MLVQKNEQERLAKAERLDALLSEVKKAEQETSGIQSWTALIRKYIDYTEIGERITV